MVVKYMKSYLKSRTLWINIIAIAGIIIRAEFGLTVTPEGEVAALAIINLILRAITNEGLKK